ncbi:MAG: AEC family transporter [Alphaproteobacteria bacterium]|nr:AEC family transporter [Alphaproteobacteria bacterium]MBV8410676.1 AEC family transporter [Alphaproteobacteria bacterium]
MTAVFLPLALIAALGAFLRHAVAGMEERRQAMNLLVLYVFLPALVFQTVMESRLDRLFFEIPIVAATSVAACLAAAFLVFHFLPIPGPTKGAMMLGCAFGNVTYLGLPVLLGTFPGHADEVAEVAVLFEVSKSSLNLTVGAMIAIAYGTQERITFRRTAYEALKLPPIWALLVAVMWRASGIPCPEFLLDAAGILAMTVTGIMMLSLGMALKFKPTRLMVLALPASAIKLLLSPWIASLVIVPLGISGLYGNAAVLEAAMPSQLLSFIIAGRFKLDEETLAFVIMANTILAFVTLPLVQGFLPVVA